MCKFKIGNYAKVIATVYAECPIGTCLIITDAVKCSYSEKILYVLDGGFIFYEEEISDTPSPEESHWCEINPLKRKIKEMNDYINKFKN